MSQCRSCGAEIMWVVTSKGKRMPIDFDEDLKHLYVDKQLPEFDDDCMVSHFATCPQSRKWRKPDVQQNEI